ncbi:MAG: hypothetical protein ACKUBY_02605 [Candidatus Moraniibacteriota bacterium]|jgi:hypothetical protein
MKKMLLITGINDLSLPLYITQEMQAVVDIDFYFFHESSTYLKEKLINNTYDYIYFGYHFRVLDKNAATSLFDILLKNKKDAYIIDNLKTIDDIYFEDKWLQYQIFTDFMPKTQLLNSITDADNKNRITKERISGRAEGIFFDSTELDEMNLNKYIIQDKMHIQKEYRIYVVCNEVLPEATVKSSKTLTSKVKVIGSEILSLDILNFTQKIIKKNTFDLIGLDLAITESGFFLIEINRTCLFNSYFTQTNINLAKVLLDNLLSKRHPLNITEKN